MGDGAVVSASSLGKAAERRVREDLLDNGYTLITAHLSRGPADILAGKGTHTLAVQVKRSSRSGGGVGVTDWNDLLDFAEAFSAVPVIAVAGCRPVRYWRLTGRKDGTKRRQPWEPYTLDFAS